MRTHFRTFPAALAMGLGFAGITTWAQLPSAKLEARGARWQSAGVLGYARSGACSALLPDGRLLIAGGENSGGVLAASEFVAADGTVSAASPILSGRTDHVWAALPDGRILVARGQTPGGGTTNAAEVYDPAGDLWSPVGNLGVARAGASTAVLRDGRLYAGKSCFEQRRARIGAVMKLRNLLVSRTSSLSTCAILLILAIFSAVTRFRRPGCPPSGYQPERQRLWFAAAGWRGTRITKNRLSIGVTLANARTAFAAIIFFCFIHAGPVAAACSGSPAVSTDKADYGHFETAAISGSGFDCGQVLSVLVTAPDGTTRSGNGTGSAGPDTVTTDASGAFVLSYSLSGTLPGGGTYAGQFGPYRVDVRNSSGTVLAGVTFTDGEGTVNTCVLTTSGCVKCWGYEGNGQLGNGSTNNVNITTPVDVQISGVAQISMAYFHTCALTTSGGVKCWGTNTYGQLGDGTNINRSAPVDVKDSSGVNLSGVAQVSAGTLAPVP